MIYLGGGGGPTMCTNGEHDSLHGNGGMLCLVMVEAVLESIMTNVLFAFTKQIEHYTKLY